MDLLSIAETIWRHKLVTLPVLLLTVLGMVYVVAIREPVYEASSSYILINPPYPPTAEQIDRKPELGRIRSDNPYTRFADQSVVANVLARTVSKDQARQALVKAGADKRYVVEPSAEFGLTAPIVQITGVGSSAETAMATARRVSKAVIEELDRMQRAHGVDARYRITTQQLESPYRAELQASGLLRSLVAVLALGVVLLFVVVSVAEALGTRRVQREPLGGLGADPLGNGLFGDGRSNITNLQREAMWPEDLEPDHASSAPVSINRSRTLSSLEGQRGSKR